MKTALGLSKPDLTPAPLKKKGTGAKRCSRNALEKRRKKSWKAYLLKIRTERAKNCRLRLENCALSGKTRSDFSQGPQMFLNPEGHLRGVMDSSPQVLSFYEEHGSRNQLIRVSDEVNVSNLEGKEGGGKGVFAICDIAADTRLCPYVGDQRCVPCDADVHCQYCLRLYTGLVVCAREHLYDQGYLMALDTSSTHGSVKLPFRCPDNYGRYFNTIFGETAESDFNCMFEIVNDGFDAMFIHTQRAVKAGEELLVDYGGAFFDIE